MALENLSRTDTIAAKIAVEIRKELATLNQSQAALARAMGETAMWLSQRLNGTIQMSVNDLARIADALGLTPSELIKRTEEPTRSYAPTVSGTVAHPDHPVLAGAVTLGPRGPRRTAPTGLEARSTTL